MNEKIISIFCTVTNDLNHDQRMHRICTTLHQAGYQVTLIGRLKKDSRPVLEMPFAQERLNCYWNKGVLFYAEYNLRLAWYHFRYKPDWIYAVDDDTLLPAIMNKKVRNTKVIFDAHEYFAEVPELNGKPWIKKVWRWIEKKCIPYTDTCITVTDSLASLFQAQYKKPFHTIRNLPNRQDNIQNIKKENLIIYQGVLNQGRGLEAMIEAMQWIPNFQLVLIGEGDLSASLRQLATKSQAAERIIFAGWLSPTQMKEWTSKACLGINLLDSESLSYYYSLANKFFDYMMVGCPSLNMNFPEYVHILNQYDVGYTIDTLKPKSLADIILKAISKPEELQIKSQNCNIAAKELNWQNEEIKLLKLLENLKK
ncbi:MAG: glycosyltransferase [Saprospiraceae bacterium]